MAFITVILHNIRSTHNVGSIFRTCEGFGVEKIILSGYTPYPTYDGDTRLPHIARKIQAQIHKTALGAETMVPFTYYEQLETWYEENKSAAQPLPLYALEQTAHSIDLHVVTPPSRFGLLLGEEVNGIADTYLAWCENSIEIPMYGRKESFNVSVSAGIALYVLQSH